ncbi:MAG: oxidoreductase n-terminal [Verrucomicrobia bacterium]|nr:oxidoreductase n-terminal [Verrucomicrobiota bacterium]
MVPPQRLRLAAIGCGSRTFIYFELAAKQPDLYEIVAAADHSPARLAKARALSQNPAFREFHDDGAILAEPKLADLMIIATQDAFHFAHASAALRRGYDLLLEKPISTNLRDVLALEKLAAELGRRVLVCHVLRYTPFYRKVKAIVASGVLGQIVSFEATEGVEPWHQAHSFVRGHWAVTEKATPMIIAKSCHDTDILSWLIDSRCVSLSSFGGILHFRAEQAPAGAPARCTDGCPVGDTCLYNALRYVGDRKGWLDIIFDRAKTATDAEIIAWLAKSPWGRCVYRCDNTAVDHQTLNMVFASGATGTFTMTAFSEGRDLAIFGTKARLLAGERVKRTAGCDIIVEDHATHALDRIKIDFDKDGWHGGGDAGLIRMLHGEMGKPRAEDMESSLQRSVESHLIGFAAEEARQTGMTLNLAEVRARLSSP